MIRSQTLVVSALVSVAGMGAALAQSLPSGNAWIDAPLPGTSFELGSVEVVAHAFHPAGIVEGRLDVNGVTVSTADPGAPWGSLAELRFEWVPELPGRFELAVFGRSAEGDWTGPGLSWVVIAGDGTTTTTSTSSTTSTTRPGATTTTTRATTTTTLATTSTTEVATTTTTEPATTTSTRPTTTTTDPRDTTTTTDPGRTTTTGRGG